MSQTNNQIEVLKRNLEEAIIVLAPKFAVSDNKLKTYSTPSFEIVDKKGAFYDRVDKKFIFSLDLIEDIPSLGEEASHYLHTELNKFHEKKFQKYSKEYWMAMNLLELVGHYGKLIYANGKEEKITTVKELYPPNIIFETREQVEDYWSYKEGYSKAEKIFAEYGDTLLPRISGMSVEKAIEILPRLAPVSFYERKILPLLDKLKGEDIKQPTVKLGN